MISGRNIKRILSLLLVTSMVLTGCGGEPKNDPSTGNTSTDDNAGKKDSVNFGLIAEPSTLDPKNTNELLSYIVLNQIYDTLVREEPDGSLVPGLAEKWEFSEDGKEVVFTIRKGVKFHNGETMTVDDVVYSINAAIESKFASMFTGAMDSMEKIDDDTAKLKLKFTYEPLLGCLSSGTMSIVSQKAVEINKDGFGRNPVGTGPYKFVEWKSGEKIALERFDDYFRGQPSIKDLTFKIITDSNTAVIALEKGELDVLDTPPKTARASLMENDKLAYYETEGSYYYHISFNNEKGIFSNKKLREAVSYAVDKEAIIIGALEGIGVPVECPIAPSSFGYQKDFKGNPYDPEKAKQLMAEAGYPDGFKVIIKTVESPTYSKPTEVLQEQLRVIGIDAEMQIMERGAWLSEVYADCNYEITLFQRAMLVPDADFGTYNSFHSTLMGNGNNIQRCNIPELDKLLDQARTSRDKEERYKLYGEISQIVKDETILIPVATGMYSIVADKNLKGVEPHPTLKYHVFNYSWQKTIVIKIWVQADQYVCLYL